MREKVTVPFSRAPVGQTVAEAFLHIYRLERACQVQLGAMACRQTLVTPSEPVVKSSADQMTDFAKCERRGQLPTLPGHRPRS